MKPVDCGRCATPHSASAHVCPKCGLRAGRSGAARNDTASVPVHTVARANGKEKIVRSRGGRLRLRSVGRGHQWGPPVVRDLAEHGLKGEITALSGCGSRVWFGTSLGCAGWFDLDTDVLHQRFYNQGAGAITAIDCGDTFVVAVSSAGSVIVIRDSDVLIVEGRMPPTHVAAARVAPRFAVARGRSVTVFEAKSAVRALHTWECVDVSDLTLSRDGHLLAVDSEARGTLMLDVQTGDTLSEFGRVDAFALSPHDLLASALDGV